MQAIMNFIQNDMKSGFTFTFMVATLLRSVIVFYYFFHLIEIFNIYEQ